jgi:hypothetical protein
MPLFGQLGRHALEETTATLNKGMLHIVAEKTPKVEREPIAVR